MYVLCDVCWPMFLTSINLDPLMCGIWMRQGRQRSSVPIKLWPVAATTASFDVSLWTTWRRTGTTNNNKQQHCLIDSKSVCPSVCLLSVWRKIIKTISSVIKNVKIYLFDHLFLGSDYLLFIKIGNEFETTAADGNCLDFNTASGCWNHSECADDQDPGADDADGL